MTYKRRDTIDAMNDMNMKFQNQMQTLLDKSEDNKPVLSNAQAIELFNARCQDLGIQAKDRQKNKFLDLMNEKCIDRKLNLEKLLLGRQSAALLAKWMIAEEISVSHLLL